MSSRVVLPVLIVAVGSLAALNQIRTSGQPPLRWLALAGVALALALVFRQLDVAGRFSSPDSWLQGHALWHILTSASLGGMYLYHRLEYRQPGLSGLLDLSVIFCVRRFLQVHDGRFRPLHAPPGRPPRNQLQLQPEFLPIPFRRILHIPRRLQSLRVL